MPPLDDLQRDPAHRGAWCDYSTYDAQATWELYHALEERLAARSWTAGFSLMDFYRTYWRPFGECLTDLERVGMYVDVTTHLPAAERAATADRAAAEQTFL
jgi:DNA polymerase I